MNIAILGTRGIPNNYGGFEQFAEFLSVGLVKRGHSVTVYNSSNHPYKKATYKDVTIKHIYDPEDKIGTIGQFVYDFLSIRDTHGKKFDIILQLGYTSSSIFYKLHPTKSIIITNMDGLEYKRTKYSKMVQKFLMWAESLAVKDSHHLISDSLGIKDYILKKYSASSTYIPYGAELFNEVNRDILQKYDVQEYLYHLIIARLEPENSIEMILDGFVLSDSSDKFLVIGDNRSNFARYLQNRYKQYKNIIFIGGIYDMRILDNLRYFSKLYFHGHTVGGTNPSLLEAMASNALICAHDNEFNKGILGEDAFYFCTSNDVSRVIKETLYKKHSQYIQKNRDKILKHYRWEMIINEYEKIFIELINKKQ